MLSAEIDRSSLEATNLIVGSNMVTGVENTFYVYPEGEPRPPNGGYGLGGTDFNLGTSFLYTKENGIPSPGKKYIVEMGLKVFETDIPPQHEWQPQGSKNYKVLWQRTLRQTVLNTATFLQNIFQRIDQQVPELRACRPNRRNILTCRAVEWWGICFGWGFFIEESQIPSPRRISPEDRQRALCGPFLSQSTAVFCRRSTKCSQA